MVHTICREDKDVWIFTYDESSFLQKLYTSADQYILFFGKLKAGICVSAPTNFNTIYFDLEIELRDYVDNFVSESGFYQWDAEHQTGKFIGESTLYPPLPPDLQHPITE